MCQPVLFLHDKIYQKNKGKGGNDAGTHTLYYVLRVRDDGAGSSEWTWPLIWTWSHCICLCCYSLALRITNKLSLYYSTNIVSLLV